MWVLFFLVWGLVAGKEFFVGGGKEKREVFFSFDGVCC